MIKLIMTFGLLWVYLGSVSNAYFVTFKDNKLDPGEGKNKLSL